MRLNNIITYNNINFKDYNCYYDGSQLFRKPQKMVTMISIPGKNGDLSMSQDRYSNIVRPFNCFIKDDFIKNYNNLINQLSAVKGYQRLETTEEPDVFYEAQFNAEIQPDLWQLNEKGVFTLEFNFKPQKWLKSGEKGIYVDDNLTLLNPSLMDALPLIECTGTGAITIGDSTLTLATNTSKTIIDCELQDAYEDTINRNPDLTVQGGFPVLKAGLNTITVVGQAFSIMLYPRWWRL